MERPDFFTLKNGEKAKLPFSNEEYNKRLIKLRSIMDKDNLDMIILTSMHNIAYYSGFIYCSFGRPYARLFLPCDHGPRRMDFTASGLAEVQA